MSIIYDALQKTQQKIKNNRDTLTQNKSSRTLHWIDIILLVVIVSLLLLVIYAYFPKSKTSSNKAPVTNEQASVTTSQEKTTSTNASNPIETAYKGKLVLNGVFLSDQETFALINNQAIHLGEYVEGKKIVAIELDKVVLLEGSQLFVLRTSS